MTLLYRKIDIYVIAYINGNILTLMIWTFVTYIVRAPYQEQG